MSDNTKTFIVEIITNTCVYCIYLKTKEEKLDFLKALETNKKWLEFSRNEQYATFIQEEKQIDLTGSLLMIKQNQIESITIELR